MAANTMTVRGLTASQRDEAGDLTITSLGDITVSVQGMSLSELAEWQWLTDTLNPGLDEETHRLTLAGWKVTHPEAGTIGLLFRGHGTRFHIEWFNPAIGDFCAAGQQARLRHGVAQILNARQHHGHPVPVDPQPEAAEPTATEAPLMWIKGGTRVRYSGSLQELHSGTYLVYECDGGDGDDCDCGQYQLYDAVRGVLVALHVSHGSITPIEPASLPRLQEAHD
ncbi:hypothetical protein LN042_22890 [Kitasatospora sp. RB6PN24]|uniref:hypothetical protein n=1 Tax=Kitasatospora humi TaxID=2893891 RepID=UPI001E3F4B34|nr:hypothetical protein [Kitasatospora humi]MCC9309882.1 hypothetical protein [Kitasatospora humi]